MSLRTWKYRRQIARDHRVIGALYLARTPLSGFDLAQVTGLGPAVHISLARLENQGVVDSEWEVLPVPPGERRPRRRYYRLTGGGS